MQFTQATNIGLHVMTYLVQQQSQKQNITIKALAQRFQVSATYLAKILAQLVKAGLVMSVPGVKGGYRLLQAPATITFADVIAALAGKPHFQDPLEDTGTNCAIAATIQAVEAQAWQMLATKRLIDLDQL